MWRSTPRGRRNLLREIDWRVETGEHWAVLGPNGAGKTTLIRIASAQLRPSSGLREFSDDNSGATHSRA